MSISDPFRLLNSPVSNVTNIARKIHEITRTSASHIWPGQGRSNAGSEHPTGRAADIMVSSKVGQLPSPTQRANGYKLATWLISIAREADIRHVIWDNKIWKTRYASQGWRVLTDDKGRPRKGISNRHEDHIHFLLQSNNGTVPNKPWPGSADVPSAKPAVTMIPRVRHPRPMPEIAIDGLLGNDTMRGLQRRLNVAATGGWDHWSVRAMNLWLGLPDDGRGILHRNATTALQGRVGAVKDGRWGTETTRKLQVFLNANRGI